MRTLTTKKRGGGEIITGKVIDFGEGAILQKINTSGGDVSRGWCTKNYGLFLN